MQQQPFRDSLEAVAEYNKALEDSQKARFREIQKDNFNKTKELFLEVIKSPKLALEEALNWIADVDPIEAVQFMNNYLERNNR